MSSHSCFPVSLLFPHPVPALEPCWNQQEPAPDTLCQKWLRFKQTESNHKKYILSKSKLSTLQFFFSTPQWNSCKQQPISAAQGRKEQRAHSRAGVTSHLPGHAEVVGTAECISSLCSCWRCYSYTNLTDLWARHSTRWPPQISSNPTYSTTLQFSA